MASYLVTSIMALYLMAFTWYDGLNLLKNISKQKGRAYTFEGYIIIVIFCFMIWFLLSKEMQQEVNALSKNELNKKIIYVVLSIMVWIFLSYAHSTSESKIYLTVLWLVAGVDATIGSYFVVGIFGDVFEAIKGWYLSSSEVEKKDKNAFLIGCGTLIFALINIFK